MHSKIIVLCIFVKLKGIKHTFLYNEIMKKCI